jgi:hypothetical protein
VICWLSGNGVFVFKWENIMSFGGGMAAGMGAGIGCGIAIGIASGRKKAAEDIRYHIESNGITIADRSGNPIKVDQFLERAISESGLGNDKSNVAAVKWLLVLLGLLIFGVLAALAIYFLNAG